MLIRRDNYLRQLISGRGNGLIKIVTGIRRCGKSFLLSRIFRDWLMDNGTPEDHIVHIPLDDRKHNELRDPDKFLEYIDSVIGDGGSYILMVDEIQMMKDFVEVLNSLLYRPNIDVYVTGSNSKFLSSDIVTEFRGRGDEIHMYPLSFGEYYEAIGGDRSVAWKTYYTFGGLPQVVQLEDHQKKMRYLENLMSTVFIKDILERHKVRNGAELDELTKIIASSIGSSTNPTKLIKTFKSLKNIIITNKTVSKYIDYMEDAFLIERAIRYNIKGKKYINTLSKYYFSDLGLRNATLEFRQLEETHIMENIIYNELLIRGFSVDVGMVEIRERNKSGVLVRKQLEVDFVANSGNERYYIQSALSMPDEEKKAQETASFRNIDDSFKKIIIVRNDIMPYTDEQGYLIIGLFDFLLGQSPFKN
ncbi:MAG: ATP-binding protein [Duncaniella sp.]|nr:ATP-binding protein [Duncaniella sp.]